MSRFRNRFLVATLAAPLVLAAQASDASPRYFAKVQGQWKGSGSVIAGKYKGTRFNCRLNGSQQTAATLDIAGTCRIGLFTQKISARLVRHGRSYRGVFLDGAQGKGMDITSGRVANDKLTVAINSKGLTGAIVANFVRRDALRVSISVRISSGEYVPVVGLDLKKR